MGQGGRAAGSVGGWVTIATFREPSAAHIARSLLDAEEIPARIADEHTVGAYWLYSQAVGGVKLQVEAEHAARAAALLDEDRSSLLTELSEDLEPEEHACPRCGSREVAHPRAQRWSALASLALWLPIVFWSRSLRCRSCGNRWR